MAIRVEYKPVEVPFRKVFVKPEEGVGPCFEIEAMEEHSPYPFVTGLWLDGSKIERVAVTEPELKEIRDAINLMLGENP